MYSLNKCVSLPRAVALLLAFLLPVLAFANSWTLPQNPTTGAGYSLRWQGSVSVANTVVMMAVLPPGSGTWMPCGSGYPDSNQQATVTGGRSFDVNGTWGLRITQQVGANLFVASSTTLQVGPQIAPLPPTNLSASNVGPYSFTLNWTASAGATSYEVFLNGQSRGLTASTSMTINGLVPSTTYSMAVKAINNAGGATSPALPVTTAVPAQNITIRGWTVPVAPTVGTTRTLSWTGAASSSTVLMWSLAPGSSTWTTCGGGGGTGPIKTVNGSSSFNVAGNWTFQIRNGWEPGASVIEQINVQTN